MSRLLDDPAGDRAEVGSPLTSSAFVPVLILGLVLMMWFAFQATQLGNERDALEEAVAAQEKPLADAKRLRDALDKLTRDTARLADGGNPNARLVVDELKKHGITIAQNASSQASPSATPKAD